MEPHSRRPERSCCAATTTFSGLRALLAQPPCRGAGCPSSGEPRGIERMATYVLVHGGGHGGGGYQKGARIPPAARPAGYTPPPTGPGQPPPLPGPPITPDLPHRGVAAPA